MLGEVGIRKQMRLVCVSPTTFFFVSSFNKIYNFTYLYLEVFYNVLFKFTTCPVMLGLTVILFDKICIVKPCVEFRVSSGCQSIGNSPFSTEFQRTKEFSNNSEWEPILGWK